MTAASTKSVTLSDAAEATRRRRNLITGWILGAVALTIALSVWYARTH